MEDIVLDARTTHTGTVIFIHGLGDTGAGWESEMMRFNRANPHLKFILPTAPKRPVTISYGQRMPAWYDIKTLSSRDHEDFDGLPESSQRIEKLIKTEIENGIPASRIVVGGFSQGAALSLYTGFRLSERLGGIIAMSGYLPIREQKSQDYINTITDLSKETPLLMCHGTADNVVRYEWGQKSFALLKSGGVQKATLRSYPNMQHSACVEELAHIQEFLAEVLPPLPADDDRKE